MREQTYQQQIEQLIGRAEAGTVFVMSDFAHLASYNCINKIFQRLEKIGKLRRIIRGVYEKPNYNEFLGELVVPSPDKVAHAIARNFGWTIVASGDVAVNVLGLSTQVPVVWLYVSDGPYKTYSFGNIVIEFRHTANRDISKFSYKTSLIIQAIRALGKDNITDNTIRSLRLTLTADERSNMLAEAKMATAWIYEFIKAICRS